MTTTDADIRRHVRTMVEPGHYDVPAIVDEIIDTHGRIDISQIDQAGGDPALGDSIWEIVWKHEL